MRVCAKFAAAAVASCLAVGVAYAGPDEDALIVDGVKYVTDLKAPTGSPLDHLYSGWRFRSDETQSLQADDFENPSFVAVDQALAEFEKPDGKAGRACANCHKDPTFEFKGLRASLPRWNEETGKPETLEMLINECRTTVRMEAEPWKWESPQMLAMTSLISTYSRGMPVKVKTDGPMAPWVEKGKELYYARAGQLNMSCAHCHEYNYGNYIRADHLSQGHTNGFPVYRLKWGGLGSIHRRFSGCMKNMRAKPFKRGSDEFIALEAYIASRGEGLSIEGPSVRN